tara:strand:+ start:3573 stop:3824 length:252 start_codon:yes stop_codon:yes gene_type:complete
MRPTNERFYQDCAKFICGYISEIKITGDKKIVQFISDTLLKSKKLYELLNDPTSDMSVIIEGMKAKKVATSKLKAKTGLIWPL